MLDEERIILMTKLASYEAKEGKKNMSIGNFFRGDYITIQVLKSIFCATVGFAVVLALYVLYNFETLMQDMYKMDLISFARNILIYYGITVVIYGVLSYAICSYRYAMAKKSLKKYNYHLKKLNAMYKR